MGVKYRQDEWDKRKTALSSLVGGIADSHSLYSKGVFGTLKKITKNLEGAESDIKKYDVDGIISFSHINRESKYNQMFEDFEQLAIFAGKVGSIVKSTIDEPFFKDIDKFVDEMNKFSVNKYKTKNLVGATETVSVVDAGPVYGGVDYSGALEFEKTEATLDDILAGDNFYGQQIKMEYELAKQ